jgi:flagellar basal body-associated protein FliL
MTHDEMVAAAREAINEVFSETSVPVVTTAESLQSLRDEITDMLDSLPDED